MWLLLRRLGLGVGLMAGAAAALLVSDWRGRQAAPRAALPRVGILQFASHSVMDDTVAGMVAGLARQGWRDGETMTLQRFNAETDLPTANAMAKQLASGEYRLVLTASTLCLQAVANANQAGRALQVFAAVSDPFGAGVGLDRAHPEQHPRHLVGLGTFEPVEPLLDVIRELCPNVQKVGTVWSPAEVNSAACVTKARAYCQRFGLELLEAPVDNTTGVLEAAQSVCQRGADCLWIGGDNTVEMGIESVVTAARQARIPVFGSNRDSVNKGLLATMGSDYEEIGGQAGELAGRLLHGLDPATVPIGTVSSAALALNLAALPDLRAPWQVPAAVRARAVLILGADGKLEKGGSARPARPAAPRKTWKLALLRFVDSEPCEEAVRGVTDGLRATGLVLDRDYTCAPRSAQGDMTMLNGLLDAASTESADLIVTFSTPTLQVALRRVEDRPIVFTYCTNPLLAGAGKSDSDHRPNVTGITTLAVLKDMARYLRGCLPQVKRVGTVFCPGEDNSRYNRDVMEGFLREAGIELVCIPASSATELPDAALALASQEIDAVCQVIDNLTSVGFPTIAKAAADRRLPVFSFVSSQAKDGAVLTLACDFYAAGKETATVIARIIRGESPAQIPIANASGARLVINLAAAQKMGITVPPEFLKEAQQVIR